MDAEELNQKGLIPGPEESEEEFQKRVEYCLNLKNNMSEIVGNQRAEEEIPQKGSVKASEYYDINPTWIPIFYSNEKLSPWHGGCAWIFQEKENSPTGAILQLRKSFSKKGSFLNIYQKEELVAHELAHVGRMMFQEPKFEEILAYQCSPSSFRRWFGPMIQSSWEALLFVVLLITILLTDLFIVLTDPLLLFSKLMWLKAIPVILLLISLGRLWIRQHTFQKCLQQLKKIAKDKALAIAFRLTDQEIRDFSTQSVEQIQKFCEENKDRSLRWKLIYYSYINIHRITS